MTTAKRYPGFQLREGEELKTVTGPLTRHVGSLIGNRIQVPHPAPPDAEPLVPLDHLPHVPLESSTSGRFPVDDWSGDDSIGWWAEARDPAGDAVRAADALAACGSSGAIFVTTHRFGVGIPEYLFAYFREDPATTERKGLFGKVLSAVAGPKKYPNHWDPFEGKLVWTWECGIERVHGVATPLVGRSFPFPKVVRVAFTDGSLLYGRYDVGCLIHGEKVKK
ncbi:hypothetical protein [Kibdelosporangium phytohabitans]|uniref:Uncharacterized protein n=1 Tax=Kibdelosporangium phytohabitans TaxID=860235 RepID=A0A0N9I305_9PSEU|nr:hypothetical protein [Kibdelosporangium phytohabitans]ALG10022.1 hypothetical protein AOZ06_26780 [Kibdelosporangium phytohabitans]MBE1468548.1 hypothetical protein [Kibdelosporangium phytohabitans]